MKKSLSLLLVLLLTLLALPTGIGSLNTPAMAVEPTIVQIAAGSGHSLALFSDGSLYAWGDNKYGQLGDGTNIDRNTPKSIGTGYTAIADGLALKGNTLYAWGNNWYGQLGDGTNIDRNTPTEVKFPPEVKPAPPVEVTGIKLNKSQMSISVGESFTLKATISPSNATNKKVSWSSSNTMIVTVSSSGVVKGIKKGSATITAKTSNGKKATCVIKVK